MAKASPTTIVEVWNKKITPTLESGDLTATEQLTLVYLAIALNRNIWEPVKINAAIIAAATGKDKRTIQKAIQRLADLGVVRINDEGEIYFGDGKHNRISAGSTGTDAGTGAGANIADTVRNNGGLYGAAEAGSAGAGEDISAQIKPAGRKRKLFKGA